MCEEHNSMLAHCWLKIDFVSLLANFFASYCYVVHTRQLLANICFSCEKCFKASLIFIFVQSKTGMFAQKKASSNQVRALKIVVAKNSCS